MNNVLTLGICAYKESPYLEDCVKSLVNQKIKCNIFISTSTPNKLISTIAKKYNLKLYVNKKSNGYYDDFLFAYKKANTKYVTLCHQDDIYLENFTEEVLKKINKNNDNIIIFSNYYDYKNCITVKKSKLLFVKRFLNFPLKFKFFQKSKFIRKRILSFGNPICSPTVTFNKDKVNEPVLKCPYRTSHDWYTWIGLCKNDGMFVYIKKPLLLRRINEQSETSLVIADNSKKNSDYEIFKLFWPDKIAKILSKIYSTSEKNNNIDYSSDLLIVDDTFPLKNSTFRYQEYIYLLKHIDNSKILSTFESIRYSGLASKKDVIDTIDKDNLWIKNRIINKIPSDIYKCKLLYCVFLFNAYNYLLPLAEKYHIDFVFTLYPGGRFSLNDKKSDSMLRKIFSSKYFKKVIVTQQLTYDYLINNKLCDKNQIEFIFGGILLEERLSRSIIRNTKQKILNICFVAYKYTSDGSDKGYDVLVDVAKKFANNKQVKFHVVGNFDENTINLDGCKNIIFYGTKSQDWFDDFYSKMDIILSPNINGKIRDGSFDGFPTSCVLEAGLNEVAMFCTDELNLNNGRFKDGEEMVIIKHDSQHIYDLICNYLDNKKLLKDIGKNGRNRILQLYSYNSQMIPRFNIIDGFLNKNITVRKKNNRLFNLKINLKIKIRYLLNKIYKKVRK